VGSTLELTNPWKSDLLASSLQDARTVRMAKMVFEGVESINAAIPGPAILHPPSSPNNRVSNVKVLYPSRSLTSTLVPNLFYHLDENMFYSHSFRGIMFNCQPQCSFFPAYFCSPNRSSQSNTLIIRSIFPRVLTSSVLSLNDAASRVFISQVVPTYSLHTLAMIIVLIGITLHFCRTCCSFKFHNYLSLYLH
jgi:hypothetical protein